MTSLTVVGVSYRGAPLEQRERLAYGAAELRPALDALLERARAQEGVLLSTCNRTELYLSGAGEADVDAVWEHWSHRMGANASPVGYARHGRDAAAHLFRVAGGLDSMILGEAQIQGQVRDAWESCRARTGAVLNRLFQTALLVAGRVRSETQLGQGAASVSSAAVQLSKQIFGSLAGRRAMVIGAGEMADLALECLVSEGVRTSIVANRTHSRAQELASRHGARAVPFEEIWPALRDVDLVLCSTAAPHPIITHQRAATALEGRGDRPLCILDIAVPRDVERAVSRLGNVFLYDMDDLQAVVASNLQRRRAQLPAAEELIAGEVERYWQWLAGLSAVPVLTRFRARMDEVRERELAAALRRLQSLTPEQRASVEQFSRALLNKFLHEPSVRLRAAAANGGGPGAIDALRYLFALDEDTAPPVAVPVEPQGEPSSASPPEAPAALVPGANTEIGER